jgi:peptidoglycan hydrolase-like protein with peptidoglycan-binding domain
MKASSLAAFLALSGVAILPACSMFGGGGSGGGVGGRQVSTAAPTSPSYASSPNYNSTQQTAGNEMSPDMIRKVQQNLNQAGLYKARVDGVWGPQTEAAVRDYQQQHNFNATGELDQQTLDAMNLGTNNNNQSNAATQNGGQQQQSTNYNPPPNNNSGQANYNPPPPNNTTGQNNNNNGSNTNSTH